MKEHLIMYYKKRDIKKEINLIHFFENLESSLETERTRDSKTPLTTLDPVFTKIKGIFLELIYQLEQSIPKI